MSPERTIALHNLGRLSYSKAKENLLDAGYQEEDVIDAIGEDWDEHLASCDYSVPEE